MLTVLHILIAVVLLILVACLAWCHTLDCAADRAWAKNEWGPYRVLRRRYRFACMLSYLLIAVSGVLNLVALVAGQP